MLIIIFYNFNFLNSESIYYNVVINALKLISKYYALFRFFIIFFTLGSYLLFTSNTSATTHTLLLLNLRIIIFNGFHLFNGDH